MRYPVDRLQIELVVCLDRHKAHVLATTALAIASASQEVVLVRFDEWPYELSRNQPDVMALCSQCSAQKMSSGARLQPDKRADQVTV
jgi:hypothetical protein